MIVSLVGCLDIKHIMSTKVGEFHKYQPNRESNQLISIKSPKTKKQKGVSHVTLLKLVYLVNFHICNNFSLEKLRKPLQASKCTV